MLEQIQQVMSIQDEPGMLMNVAAFGLGLALHIGKKCLMEKVSLREYINEHKMNTYLSMGSLVSTFSYLQSMHTEAPVIMYALAGYCIDSVMNRSPLSLNRVENEIKPPRVD